MVKTVLIDVQTSFAVGALVALASWRQIQSEKTGPLSRYVIGGGLFGLVYGLGVGWMCLKYPDWMWCYALPIQEFPLWVWYPPFVLANVVGGLAGAQLAQTFIGRGSVLAGFLVGVVGLIMLAGVWAVTWEQYFSISTYADWHAVPRVATPMMEDATFQANMNGVAAVQVIGGLAIVLKFFIEGFRAPRP